jgi:hypothetical protein
MTINDRDAPDKSSPSLSKRGTEGELEKHQGDPPLAPTEKLFFAGFRLSLGMTNVGWCPGLVYFAPSGLMK